MLNIVDMNKQITMDSGEMCRTCLYSGVPMYPLFDTPLIGSQSPPAAELLKMFTEILISRIDGYPDKICMACFTEINRAYAFKTQCEKSEATLEALFKVNSLQSKENDVKYDISLIDTNLNYSNQTTVRVYAEGDITRENSANADKNLANIIEHYTTPGIPLFYEDFVIEEVMEDESMELEEKHQERQWQSQIDEVITFDPSLAYDYNYLQNYYDRQNSKNNESLLKQNRGLYTCKFCPMEFSLIRQYREHMFEHTGKHEFQCDVCSKIFQSRMALLDHQKIHTGEKPFRCEKCGLRFRQKNILKKHALTHSNGRPHKCTVCYMKFKENYVLLRHMREQHCSIKLHSCEYCPMKFKRRDQLKKHTFDHTGEHTYKCDICYVALWDRKHQIEHMRIHTGEKPFKCEICYKSFRLKRVYERHKQSVHHEQHALKCPLCPSSYKLIYNLNRHITETHITEIHNVTKEEEM